MIPYTQQIAIDQMLIDKSTGKVFTVLCNCQMSTPVRHTQRFVNANREMFDLCQPSTNTTSDTSSTN